MSLREFSFSGKGEIYSYTTIFERQYAPNGFEDSTPYTVALVRLEEGPLVTAMLTDLDFEKPREAKRSEEQRVYMGQRVELATRRLFEDEGTDGDRKKGIVIYGYHARPTLQPAPQDFSLEKLIELAMRSAAHPDDRTLEAQYSEMFVGSRHQ